MRFILVVLVVTGVSACGGIVDFDRDSGSGMRTDGSVVVTDAGSMTDTGRPVADSGVVVIDSGGEPSDAGVPTDSGLPIDAGPPTTGDGKGWRCTPLGTINTCSKSGHVTVDCVQDVDDGGFSLGLGGGNCSQVCPKPVQSCCANLCNYTKVNAHEYTFDCTQWGGC